MKTTFAKLMPGHIIKCPQDGRTEVVKRIVATTTTGVHIRTNHHDHCRPKNDPVELLSTVGANRVE